MTFKRTKSGFTKSFPLERPSRSNIPLCASSGWGSRPSSQRDLPGFTCPRPPFPEGRDRDLSAHLTAREGRQGSEQARPLPGHEKLRPQSRDLWLIFLQSLSESPCQKVLVAGNSVLVSFVHV